MGATAKIEVQGWCEVDGVKRNLSGIPPVEFTVAEGHRFLFSFTCLDRTKGITVHAWSSGAEHAARGFTSEPPKGIRGWVEFGRWGTTYWMEEFDDNNPKPWRSPPQWQ